MTQVDVERAQTAYAAYGDVVGWRNHQGRPMPRWGELGEVIQSAWIAAAAAVVSGGRGPEVPPQVLAAVRTGIQVAGGLLVTWAASRGVHLPGDLPAWVDPVVLVVATGAWTAVVRWAEGHRAAWVRTAARVVMLGIRSTPVYGRVTPTGAGRSDP